MGHDKGYTPTETACAFELAAPEETPSATIEFAAFALIWSAVTIGLGVFAFLQDQPILWVFCGVFALFDLVIVGAVYKRIAIAAKWQDSKLVLNDWPLQMGATSRGWFVRPLDDETVTPQPLAGRLVVRETAVYQVGTDTRTAEEDLQTTALVMEPEERNGIVGYRFDLVVDGPPTIQLDNNLVEWIVEIDVDHPNAPAAESIFTILVEPRLADTR
ncbi:MAG: hypothetical protein KJO18_02820, partial [Acidimicrobiia bacterium]|nr:hypothetical protein [Acidimicrobiia bacterium]